MAKQIDPYLQSHRWLINLVRYLAAIAVLNLLWEIIHLPLYTLWENGSQSEIIFSVIHCTGGDVVIALCAITLALIWSGYSEWPVKRARRVFIVTLALGLAYTGFSEWLNIEIRRSWAYSDLMPIIPFLNMGLSPALQWIIVPWIAYYWAIGPNWVRAKTTAK